MANPPTKRPEAEQASGAELVEADGLGPSLADVVEVQSPRARAPRLETLEALSGQGQWAKVIELLEPLADALPAPHRLYYAIALRESAGSHPDARRADTLSIQAFAELLGVPRESPLALLLARRVLRKAWRQAPAPRPWVQFAIMVAAVVLGALAGWVWDEWNDRRAAGLAPRAPAAAVEGPAR